MCRNKMPAIISAFAVLLAATGTATADVFNMPPGLTSLQMVSVGNPGNDGELSGIDASPNGHGPDRVCGAVGYKYWMGRFEVTAGQYCEFLNAVARTDPYELYHVFMDYAYANYGCNIKRSGSSGNYTYSVAADWANRPVNFVSWGDAARFANWLNNGQPTGTLTGTPAQDAWLTEDGSYYLNGATTAAALLAVTRKVNARYVIPAEDEWYKAAYYDPNKPGGAGYWDYPTRSNTVPSNVFDPTGTNNANYYNGTYTIGAPYWRNEVGAFANSPSPYGTFDQGGNLWEWSEAVIYGTNRGLRGGWWASAVDVLSAASRNSYDPTGQYYSFGFRIAEVPEPASAGLIGLGWFLLAVRRKRREDQ